MTDSLIERVRTFLNEERENFTSGHLLVAVSAGQDSCALLHCLSQLREEFQLSLTAAHLNHGIRGAEADEDQAFAVQLAESLGVPVETGVRDVKSFARRGHQSTQVAARELRHSFLSETAERLGVTLIALGHTQDDHIETVLLNLFRGAGIDGLRGLPRGSGRIVRPLRDVSREETAEYCRANGIAFREDRSNRDLKYLRNRLREELVPNLAAHYNPAIREAVLCLSESATADSDFLRGEAESAFALVLNSESESSIALDRAGLLNLHPAVQRRVVRLAIQRLQGHLLDVSFDAVESALKAAASRKPMGRTLPGDRYRILTDAHTLRVCTVRPQSSPVPIELKLAVPGRTEAFGGIFTTTIEDLGKPLPCDRNQCVMDADSIQGTLKVRNRRPGDRMRPLGMRGTNKIQDILVDAKVPEDRRDRVPIVLDDLGPVWIVGHVLSDRVKVSAKSRQILRIRYEEEPVTGLE